MQFASAGIYGVAALESDIRQQGVQSLSRWYIGHALIHDFQYVPGSSEYPTLSSSISNHNLEVSVSMFFPTGMKVYSPGDIIKVCAKFVALPNQAMSLNTTIHQISVTCLCFLYHVMY